VFNLEGVGEIKLIVDGARFFNFREKNYFRPKDASHLASTVIGITLKNVTCHKKGFF